MSYAAIFGLIQQANLKGQEYSVLVALFYVGYLLAEYPTIYLMQKFPTGKYITVNFILWGNRFVCPWLTQLLTGSLRRHRSRIYGQCYQLCYVSRGSILPWCL